MLTCVSLHWFVLMCTDAHRDQKMGLDDLVLEFSAFLYGC